MAGSRVQLWQHPFVDVFKYVSLQDWRLAHKEGEVSEVVDPVSKKKAVKLAGSISAANYIQIPKTASSMKTLGLTGKFLYVLVQVQPGKLFSMHFDLSLTTPRATRLFRLSVSNLYKANKLSSTLQLACPIGPKWSVLVVNLPEVLGNWASDACGHQLKSIVLCASMMVRGVFTSDILYTVKTLPKEMQFRVKEGAWADLYDWITLPLTEDQNANPEESKELKPKKTIKAPKRLSSPVKRQASPAKRQPSPSKDEPIEETKAEQAGLTEESPQIEQTFIDPFPDPISSLNSILHVTAKPNLIASASASYFAAYGPEFVANTSEILITASNCTILASNPSTGAQQFLFAHTEPIRSLSCRNGVLASSDSKLVFIWNIKTRRSPVVLTPKFFSTVQYVQLNDRGIQLAISGLDEHQRVLLSVWNLVQMAKKQGITLEAKQLSDFEIEHIRFSPFDEGRLVTCGKESIRFWRVKHRHLPGHAVVLNTYSRAKFTGLAVALMDGHKKVVAVSDGGCVFVINYHSREIEAVKQLHDTAIWCLDWQGEFWVTGGEDHLVKVWSNEFDESMLEAEHPAAVVAVCLSATSAYCITANSVVGELDLNTNSYRILTRSHTEGIVSSAVHLPTGSLLTIGEDKSIRLWNEAYVQIYEYSSPSDEPTAVSASPTADSFVVGFQSGTVRLFEMGSLQVLEEFTSHVTAVILIQHSADGKWAITISEEGAFTLLDAQRKYIAIKHVLAECPGEFNTADFAPDSSEFAIAGAYGNGIDFWDLRTLNVKKSISLGASIIQQLQYSNNCLDLVVLVLKETAVFAFFDSQRQLYREMPLSVPARKFQISPNWRYIISVHEDHLLRVWDYRGEHHVQAFLGHSEAPSNIEFGKDMRSVLTTAPSDGTFVWTFRGDNSMQPVKLSVGPAELVEQDELDVEIEEPLVDMGELVDEYLRHAHLLTGPTRQEAALSLARVVGFTPQRQVCLVWAPSKGWFAYTCGVYVIVHFLQEDGRQQQLRHLDPVTCLSISPNFETLASASSSAALEGSGNVHLWSVNTGSIIATLALHEAGVRDLSFSPCGNYLVSLGCDEQDQALVVWDVRTASMLTHSVLDQTTHSIKWSPMEADAEFTTFGPDSLAFWRLNLQLSLDFQPSSLPIRNKISCGTYSPVLKTAYFLFLGTEQGTVQVWEGRTNSFVKEFAALQGSVLTISCKSKRLVVGGESAYLLSWDWTKSLCKEKPDSLLLESFALNMWLEDPGDEGLVCTAGGTIWYINWVERATVRIVNSHSAPVTALASMTYVASASEDGSIRVWNSQLTEQLLQFMLPNHVCRTLDFHPQDTLIAAGFDDGSLRFFNAVMGKTIGKCYVFDCPLTSAKFCADGDTVICGSSSGRISVVLVECWEPLAVRVQDFGMAGSCVVSIDISPREPSRVLLASTNDGKTNVWEKKLTAESLTSDRLIPNEAVEFNLVDFYRVLDAELASERLAYDITVSCK